MASKTLTMAGIKSIRPKAIRQEIKDAATSGLYLVVQSSGHKSFAMRFRSPDGRPVKLVLGGVDFINEGEGEAVLGRPLTLSAARRLASDINHSRAMGNDVVADLKIAKDRKRFEQETSAKNTFSAAVEDFITRHAKVKTRGWRATASLLGLTEEGEVVRGGLSDRWSDRPVAEISGGDVYGVIEEARRIGVPGRATKYDGPSKSRARHLHSTLSTLFGWLHRHRRIDQNPVSGVHRPEPGRARDRVLTDGEIVKFWNACASVGEPFGSIFRLLLLTGCRLNEVAGMRRGELSDDLETWTIPGARVKNHLTHIVPLPPTASAIVASNITDREFVFTCNGVTQVCGWTKSKKRLRPPDGR